MQRRKRKVVMPKRAVAKVAGIPKTVTKKEVKELGLLARALRVGGGLAGGAAGSFFGPSGIAAGSSAGSGLGAAISRWLGAGDYTLSQNSIVKRSGEVPTMHQGGESTILRHREYITDIVTSSSVNTFNQQRFSINPGLDNSFPWLCGIARQYQEYSFKGLVYHFVTTSGNSVGSTTTSLPTVMMATQYKAGSAAFTDKQTLLNEYFSTDAKASESFCHPVECDPRENPFNIQYVRGAAVPNGEDVKTYDLGTFTIATAGSQAASVTVGELWVTYELELKKPLSSNALDVYQQCAHYSGAAATTAARLGTSRGENFDSIGMTFPSNNSIAFPVQTIGLYQVQLWWRLTTAITGMVLTPTNCTLETFYEGTNQQQFVTSAALTTGGGFCNFLVRIINPVLVASVTIGTGALTGATTADIIVTQLSSDFV
jgi:hypothetical protein